ncbi:MAG: UDP-N-acetylglucosamine--N-acetylmuramyl-(pentapeptide) pyrophosphoryl-undecaprenol N-acetylglucosamine transferase [Planctomycetes bacterium]|nr:UDP-N-acetylglucosamine--N-acetylmuramyl-(pentapeptide) pyrophosphoryl-undecaprenol N-acetylglucosamine transferase [Planctomycetota bacterium]
MTQHAIAADAAVLAIAGGGTGGHLYPALAVAAALRKHLPQLRVLVFGTQRAIDQRVLGGADCELVPQSLSPPRAAPWRWPRFLLDIRRAGALCRERFGRARPRLVLGTGGFASVPAVREAARLGIPTALLNPDALPGKANRLLARWADAVFVQWPDTEAHLPRGCPVRAVGCPVRPEFIRADRSAAMVRFGLDPARKTLLVTGASQGARTINDAVVALRGFLGSFGDWQILHLTGEQDWERVRRACADRPLPWVALPYTDQMAEALAAADLVISRAGASTLAELTALGRASVLMPYPFHRDMHQTRNARCLERRGAACLVPDAVDPAANAAALQAVLASLMSDACRREAMAAAAARMGRPDAAQAIADDILVLIGATASSPGTSLNACKTLEGSCSFAR